MLTNKEMNFLTGKKQEVDISGQFGREEIKWNGISLRPYDDI